MSEKKPLWPQPIEIVGLTGEYASGKTLFGLTIDPKSTLVFDTEKSTGSYSSLGFERIDIPAKMQALYPKGYKPIDTFNWWWNFVKALPPGKYRVIGLDTASEIESGLADWVTANPGYFGRTAAQYVKMSGVMWGDVKELWKAILSDLAARCETFYFTTHLTNVWAGDKPLPGKRKAKGKETLMELASLYLHMERRPDAQGNRPAKPAALVLKTRLAHTGIGADGEIQILPVLPPRLPVATPAAIRKYMETPPDYSALKPEEQAPEHSLTADERELLALARAEAERDAAAYKLEAVRVETTPREGRAPGTILPPRRMDGARDEYEPERAEQGQEVPGEPAAARLRPTPAPADLDAIKQYLSDLADIGKYGDAETLSLFREKLNLELPRKSKAQGEALRRAIAAAEAAIAARAPAQGCDPGPAETQETAAPAA